MRKAFRYFVFLGLVGLGIFAGGLLVAQQSQDRRQLTVLSVYDGRTFITAKDADRRRRIVYDFVCILPTGDDFARVDAKQARYVPPGKDSLSGGWLLSGALPPQLDSCPACLKMIAPGRYFLHTTDVDFDTLTRHGKECREVGELSHGRASHAILGMLLAGLYLLSIACVNSRAAIAGTGVQRARAV